MLKDANHNAIWSSLQAGEPEALLALYEHFYLDFMNYGLRLTGDRTLTSDGLTQVLLVLWDKRRSLPPVYNLRAYLLTCLRHELYHMLRSDKRRTNHAAAAQCILPTEERSYEDYLVELQTTRLLKDKLTKALGLLTEREKELLRLKFFQDFDYDEIAAQCGITKRTAYNIVHRALETLRGRLAVKTGNSVRPGTELLPLLLLLLTHLG
jgi:RNA polymerase sigma-70 factor (ECF subfamily)